MDAMTRGRFRVREAAGAQDVAAAQDLRRIAFRGAGGPGARDADAFDAGCRHVLVEEIATGALVACYRLLPLASGAAIGRSYAAQFYDLGRLQAFPGRILEMGRFCLHPDRHDPDILRAAWAMTTRIVDAEGVALLMGCSSFRGTDAAPYEDAFAALGAGHLAPGHWRPEPKAPDVYPFARALAARRPDPRRAQVGMPPLLRSYLMLGGWVSDHAVVDTDLDTLHVFTALEVAAIPPARARSLRAVAA